MVSLYLNGYLNRLFVGNKLTDPVNERSSHNYPATRSGGLSIFFTVCVASAFAVATNELSFPLYVLLSVFFMTLTGFADDLIEVRYREKLFLQIFAGILMIQSGYYIDSFHGVFGVYELPYWLSVFVSLFVFVVVVNALNLIDGLDGLASFLSLKFFLVAGGIILIADSKMFLFFPIIVGALVGFLTYNFKRSQKVFLGDTGSLFLGSIMSFLIFYILDTENSIITDSFISRPFLTVLMLIYPLVDTLRAFSIRAYRNQSPFVADRIHLHHRLADKGYKHWQASLLIFMLSSLTLLLNCLLFTTLGLIFSICFTLLLLPLFYLIFFK
jgi:UDP-N-acetylmuramyl pentapeptide phosphotransferase/UDP-N-acetylglucosamine-1-phosphate transferase